MAERVGPEGSLASRLVLIGEAPGTWEHQYGRPFVGPSYNDKLRPWWESCTPRLDRALFYITNVLDYQPANIHTVPEPEMRAAFDALHTRLAQLEDPWLIVPTGNTALYALTGNGRVSFHAKDGHHDRPGITDWRGSVLQYEDKRGRKIKVIPTLHPAALFRRPADEWLCRMDWQRIAEDALFRELRLPTPTRMIAPSKAEAIEWIRWTRAQAAAKARGEFVTGRLACSLDVETPKKAEYETQQKESVAKNGKCRLCTHTHQWHVKDPTLIEVVKKGCLGSRGKGCECLGWQPPLSKPRKVKIDEYPYLGCSGYSWDPKVSLTIPTTLEFWQDPAVWADVKAEMAAFHADANIDFGGQNFGFDAWWCAVEGMRIHAIGWDLMKMHRVQRPYSDVHDLATQASVDTRHPFWKHEAKLPDQISRWSHNKEQLWAYNGTDNCAQRGLLDARFAALHTNGRWDYYATMEAPIDDGLLEMSLHGIRADEPGRDREYARVAEEAMEVAAQINAAAGMALFGKNGIAVSTTKMKAFLYTSGTPVAVYERPVIEVTAASAKCTNCQHAKSWHVTEDGALVRGCTKKTKGLAPAMCSCPLFVAPTKLGRRVKTGETPGEGGLRLPVQYTKAAVEGGGKRKVITVNIVAIRRLMDQFPTIEKLQTVGALVLRHRRLLTIKNFVKAERIVNGRQYAIFKQDTLLGRLSSSETPKGQGSNLQNVDRRLRKYFLPDTGDEPDAT